MNIRDVDLVHLHLPYFFGSELIYFLNKFKDVPYAVTYHQDPLLRFHACMACGTPVLVTAVGGVPDVIVDGQTGFLMQDNSPACITKNTIRALRSCELEYIAINARKLVEKRFTYETAVEGYKNLLSEFLRK